MEEFVYDIKEKEKCWYKSICDKTRCGDNFCIRHYKMSCLLHLACMEGNLKYPITLRMDEDRIDLQSYTELRKIQTNINDFVLTGKNLLIYSENPGNGKTEWSKKLLLSWFDSIWSSTDLECRGLFVSLPKLISAMKSNISKSNEYFQYVNENLLTADIVVWDEMNYKDYSEFEHEYLLNVIDQRMSMGKSNIFTTNFRLDEIRKKLGSRLSSRVINNSIKVEFKGKDKRGTGVG